MARFAGTFEAAAGLTVVLLAAASAAIVVFARPAPLAVVHIVPADGAGAVPTASRVTVTFNRPIDEARAEAAVTVSPDVDGYVSAAGRRLAFTPRGGFRPDTDYVVTVEDRVQDRAGRPLPAPVVVRFRTRGPGLVVLRADGRLVRVPVRDGRPGGLPEPVGGPASGPFDVGPTGEVAYLREGGRALVATGAPGGAPQTVGLPRGLEVRDLAFAPRGRTLLLLGAEGDGPIVPYLVRLDAAAPAVEPFGPRPEPLAEALIVEKLKRSLNAIVYRRESAAFTPDGRAAIVRDSTYDLAVVGLDGRRRGSLGPFLAVADVSPVGDAVYLVDLDPADGLLRRRVLAYGRDGTTRTLSAPDRDSDAPRASHGGDRVAYVTAEPAGPPGERRYGVEVVTVASGERLRMTEPPPGMTDLEPRWSPDDAWLAFRRAPVARPAEGAIWLVRSAGGDAQPLEDGAAGARWSR